MDDLLGEDWQKSSKATTSTSHLPTAFASNYSSLRASPQLPISGASTPSNVSRPPSAVNGSKSTKGDAFGSLTGIKSLKPGADLSIQEKQKQLVEERRQQQEQQAQIWEGLGSGRATPEVRGSSPAFPQPQPGEDDDILAAFNKDAPVNRASHFAPPPLPCDVSGNSMSGLVSQNTTSNGGFDDDDDPFGLGELSNNRNGTSRAQKPARPNDDGDILGDLGKPVSRKPTASGRSSTSASRPQAAPDSGISKSKELNELIAMGFPVDTAQIALGENGGNVQGAVGWILQQAHEESRQKAKGEMPQARTYGPSMNVKSPQRRPHASEVEVPAWMKHEAGAQSKARQQNSVLPAVGQRDPAQAASEIGSKLFKSANSLWKASQKQMAKTVADFQQQDGGDSGQPKWMRDATSSSDKSSTRERPAAPARSSRPLVGITDEAALLDAPRERVQTVSRPPTTSRPESLGAKAPTETLPFRPSSQSRATPQAASSDRRPINKFSRQEVDDLSSQAYVSPARRKRQPAQPQQNNVEVDLFNSAPSEVFAAKPVSRPIQKSTKRTPTPARSVVQPRNIPAVSPAALQTSTTHRKAGGEQFKRGDYAAAHTSYTTALDALPNSHPHTILILSNRALTALKTGDAKTAVSDADRALVIIGPSQGSGEHIDLGPNDGTKEMHELFGKAIMRKAEALEQLERYADAAMAWRQAVSAGVGGAVSLKARDRCEKAAAPEPTVRNPARPVRPFKPPANAARRALVTNDASNDALRTLRAANAAADKVEDEKFALLESVEARLNVWRGGKAENLRALLQSMDAVLWDGAGWKKVGMADLVMANKVKVIYIKAIAKVHPDKVRLGSLVASQQFPARFLPFCFGC